MFSRIASKRVSRVALVSATSTAAMIAMQRNENKAECSYISASTTRIDELRQHIIAHIEEMMTRLAPLYPIERLGESFGSRFGMETVQLISQKMWNGSVAINQYFLDTTRDINNQIWYAGVLGYTNGKLLWTTTLPYLPYIAVGAGTVAVGAGIYYLYNPTLDMLRNKQVSTHEQLRTQYISCINNSKSAANQDGVPDDCVILSNKFKMVSAILDVQSASK